MFMKRVRTLQRVNRIKRQSEDGKARKNIPRSIFSTQGISLRGISPFLEKVRILAKAAAGRGSAEPALLSRRE